MSKAKNKAKQKVIKNPLEQLFEGSLDSIMGVTSSEKNQKLHAGVMEEGQEISLKDLQDNKKAEEKEEVRIEAGINYAREIIEVVERSESVENCEIEAQLREIMNEIKKLADSSKELSMQFKTVAVEQYVAKPGKYHKNFFSWLLSVIRAARMKIEDSGAWLAALHSKKKSREYGAMAKKQGTSFTLNNERTVATQVG
jgi:hypothetical protein